MINQQRLVNEFMDMVKVDSPSKKEGQFAAYLKEKLLELGLEVVVDQQAGKKAGSDTGNLLARWQGNKAGLPTILFSAHMDTVSPSEGIRPQIKDGVICSSGDTVLGSDDKAAIAAILEAIRHLHEKNKKHGDIEVLFTVGEEVGLLGARYLDYSLLQAQMGFVLDSDGEVGTIVCRAPSHERINAAIYGKAAHAGMNPEEGVSAIQVAARAIDRMALLRIDEETTANIGVIKGGNATNIVCEKVELQGEVRSLAEKKLQEQIKHMIDCLQTACDELGARLEVKVTREYSTFKINEGEQVVEVAKQAGKGLKLPVKLTSSGGGSDTNYFSAHGIKTVNLGIGMNNPHTKEEYVKIDDLVMTARYIVAIIEQVALSGD